MTGSAVRELIMIVKSIQLNIKKDSKYLDKDFVKARCENFCKDNNINITHGSAYKELRHKYYYYTNKCINSIIYDRVDLYEVRKYNIISDKLIVDTLLERKPVQ